MEITVDLLEFVLAAADNWGGAGGAYRDRCRRGVYRSNNDDSAAAALTCSEDMIPPNIRPCTRSSAVRATITWGGPYDSVLYIILYF